MAYRNGGGRTLDNRGATRSHESPLVRSLAWRKIGKSWQLIAGRRRFGTVVPDSKYPGMWRSPLSGGRLSDMANLSWARNAVLEAAIREIEWETRQAAITPSNSQQNGAVFQVASSPMDLNGSGHPNTATRGFPPGRLLGGSIRACDEKSVQDWLDSQQVAFKPTPRSPGRPRKNKKIVDQIENQRANAEMFEPAKLSK